MASADEPASDTYDAFYRTFDSPLMQQIRREAYDEDIGQHSWVRVDEMREDVRRLALVESSRLIDLGCGPCGPLTFVLAATRCVGTGVDASRAALHAGRARAASLGVESLLSLHAADLDAPLEFAAGSFDAAMRSTSCCTFAIAHNSFAASRRCCGPVPDSCSPMRASSPARSRTMSSSGAPGTGIRRSSFRDTTRRCWNPRGSGSSKSRTGQRA